MNKDWKGNSNSLRAAISVKSPNSTNEREQDDFYATDPEALRKLLDGASNELTIELWQSLKYSRYIWECACGNGNLAKELMARGYNVLCTDLKDRGFGFTGRDFLQEKKGRKNCKIILTNPPFSLATEFILHALDILPKEGIYIALMNITYLAGQKRYREIYSKGCLREVYVFSKRVECWKNGERPKDKCGSIANYAWYVFQKGYKGRPTIYWL